MTTATVSTKHTNQHPSSVPKVIRSRAERVRRTRNRILAVLFCLAWGFPVYWMVITSFKPRSDVMSAVPQFIPANPTLENYFTAFSANGFLTGIRNSIVVSIASVIFGLVVGLFAATALSRFRFRGRRSIMVTILVVQMLPGTALLIPSFLIFAKFNLVDSYLGLSLAYVAAVLPFTIWVMRGFFVAIPYELDEAAMVDGAGPFRVMWSILFPLVAPGAVACSVFAFVVAWNDYLIAFVFMKDQRKYTLPVWLNSFENPLTGTDFGAQMAASVVFSIPVVIFFLMIQKRLVEGLSAGAVKG